MVTRGRRAAIVFVLLSLCTNLATSLPQTAGAASPIPGLELAWPLTLGGSVAIGQDYAQFNLLNNNLKHHAGLDIGAPEGTTVRSAAQGRVVKIQGNDVGCNPSVPGACEDHGFGNTVIIEHDYQGSGHVYTQYSHLASIPEALKLACGPVDPGRRERRTCAIGVPLNSGDIIGTVGGTCYGQTNCTTPHLHFELKRFNTLGTSGDDEPDFAYTAAHPDGSGYFDPILNLHQTSAVGAVRVRVTSQGQGALLRVAPADHRSLRSVIAGEEFIAFASSLATANPACTDWWYQVRPTELSSGTQVVLGILYFVDPTRSPSSIPDAWICRGTAGQVWLEPTAVQTFADVPPGDWGLSWIRELYRRAVTAGCLIDPITGAIGFCPDNPATRREMAVFLLRGANFVPCWGCSQSFADVLLTDWGFGWIEELFRQGITAGCLSSPLRYCPDFSVSRREMAVFILRAMGRDPCTNCQQTFVDVPVTDWGFGWIEALYRSGITAGCSYDPTTGQRRFCPDANVTRREMSVFLVRAFPNVGGRWNGTWASTVFPGAQGTLTANLAQAFQLFTGSILITGSGYISSASVSGSLNADSITFGVVDFLGTPLATFQGTISGNTASGTYVDAFGIDRGTWSATRP